MILTDFSWVREGPPLGQRWRGECAGINVTAQCWRLPEPSKGMGAGFSTQQVGPLCKGWKHHLLLPVGLLRSPFSLLCADWQLCQDERKGAWPWITGRKERTAKDAGAGKEVRKVVSGAV